jgi:hypothetical protein
MCSYTHVLYINMIISSGGDDGDSSSESDESVRVCDCERCYEGSTETCRECNCSGCETDTVCLYPDEDEDAYVTHDAAYWEKKANSNQDTANYLTVDLRKQVRKLVKTKALCDQHVQFARNEQARMKASTEEKILLIEADCKHQIELSKQSEAHMLEVVMSRAKEIGELENQRSGMQEEIDRLKKELVDVISQNKLSSVKQTGKRERT